MRVTTSVVPTWSAENRGRLVVAHTVSERPSGRLCSARIRSAISSDNSRAESTISSRIKWVSRKLVPTTFQ